METKEIKINVPEGYEIDKENSTFECVKFKKKAPERWIDTDKKLISLQEANIKPCSVPGFCATNSCAISNNDTIMFFNTRKEDYDKFINAILVNANEALRVDNYNLPMYSLIKLNSKNDNIKFFSDNIVYKNSLSQILEKAGKKALIITDEKNISLVNLLANGLNSVNNPAIQFMKLNDTYYNDINNITGLIDNSVYDLIIFDYHMDTSKTVTDLKEQLSKIDIVLGNVAAVCENKHSLFITSLYGMKKNLPLAPYNTEMVMIDYEMQIPIFFFDYTYPRSKYALFPGETNDILNSAIRCIWDNSEIYTLVKPRGIITNLIGAFKK